MSNSADNSAVKRYRLIPSTRFGMVLITFLGVLLFNGIGFANLNFTLVCMVNRTYLDAENASVSRCIQQNVSESDNNDVEGSFEWTKTNQGNLLAGYSWGTTIACPFTGYLVDRFGVKVVMFVGYLLPLVATALTPIAAHNSLAFLFACRILIGIGCSMAWPCILKTVSHWAAPNERAFLIAIMSTGFALARAIANPIDSLFCSGPGWEYAYYFWSGIYVIWCLLCLAFFADSPQKTRWISDKEREYLEASLPKVPSVKPKTPWLALFKSPVIWAISASQSAYMWFNFFASEFLPTYIKEAYGLDVGKNGLLSALPSIAQTISQIVVGYISDYLTFASPTLTVKVYNTIGLLMAVVFVALCTVLGCGQALIAMAFLMVAFGFTAVIIPGYSKSIVLVSGPHVGVVSSITASVAYVATIAMPYATGALTSAGTMDQWDHAFYLTGAVLAVGCVVFALFGSGERQKWAEIEETEASPQKAGIENPGYICDAAKVMQEDVTVKF